MNEEKNTENFELNNDSLESVAGGNEASGKKEYTRMRCTKCLHEEIWEGNLMDCKDGYPCPNPECGDPHPENFTFIGIELLYL